jgi:hypothetical protein
MMARTEKIAGTAIAAGVLLALSCAATATAAAPQPFTITELVDFNTGLNTFTANGPLCPSGTFVDTPKTFAGRPDKTGKINIVVKTVYTCDDSSGTFNATKQIFLTLNDDGSSSNTGPINFHGGTGRYSKLSGHGVDNGHATAEGIGVGQISGVIVGP